MPAQYVSSLQPGNFVFDGAYIQQYLSQQALPSGPPTNFIGGVGPGSWGKIGVILTASDEASIYAAVGRKTTVNKSIARELLSALPECRSFKISRVSDGTDTPAAMSIKDTAGTPAIVLTGTAVCSGSDGNFASILPILQSGTMTVSPVIQITVMDPFGGTQVYSNIIAYATAGGAYDAPTFKANALAVLNGTAPNSTPNPYFVFTSGPSAIAPAVGTAIAATGGTDGDSGVTDSSLIGTDAQASSTGMYTLRGAMAGGQIVLAVLTTPANFQTVAAFAQQEGCTGWVTFASGTTTPNAISTQSTNNMKNDYMGVVMDWVNTYDPFQKKTALVSPIGKAAGIIASLPPEQYPGNRPVNGCVGVISTERTVLGPIHGDEAAQRESNGILWIGQTANGVMGLPHGLTSSGRQFNEVRMLQYVGYSVGLIMSRFVGAMMQTTLPIAQADGNDARNQCGTALRQFFGAMQTSGNRRISAAQVIVDDSNNTTTTMQQGRLLARCLVTTLTGVQYAVAAIGVGNSIQIQTTPVGG